MGEEFSTHSTYSFHQTAFTEMHRAFKFDDMKLNKNQIGKSLFYLRFFGIKKKFVISDISSRTYFNVKN